MFDKFQIHLLPLSESLKNSDKVLKTCLITKKSAPSNPTLAKKKKKQPFPQISRKSVFGPHPTKYTVHLDKHDHLSEPCTFPARKLFISYHLVVVLIR